jgi:hypothetical protein
VSEHPGEPDQRSLARDVRQQIPGRWRPERVRDDRDDPPKAALAHARRELLGEEQHRLDVHSLDPAERRELERVERHAVKRAGRVDEQIAAPVIAQDDVGGVADLLGIGEVARHVAVAVDDDDSVATTAQRFGDRPGIPALVMA